MAETLTFDIQDLQELFPCDRRDALLAIPSYIVVTQVSCSLQHADFVISDYQLAFSSVENFEDSQNQLFDGLSFAALYS